MKFLIYIYFIGFFVKITGQETILNTSFTVRDFDIIDNTLLYIEKRDLKNFNLLSKTHDTLIVQKGFFIGGYGLKLTYDRWNKKIVTSSNELIRDISSIRFYDTYEKTVNKFHVYYTTELMDFLVVPNDSLFFLSKKNNKIEIFRYGGVPRYQKMDSISLNSFSRKLRFFNNDLYFVTDFGELYLYNIKTRSKKLLYKTDDLFINFVCDSENENIFITTFGGDLIKINFQAIHKPQKINISNDIIEAIDIVTDKYIIVGDFKGRLNIIDINTMKILKSFNNKHRIVKIITKGDYFYTSSADRTIRRWKF